MHSRVFARSVGDNVTYERTRIMETVLMGFIAFSAMLVIMYAGCLTVGHKSE